MSILSSILSFIWPEPRYRSQQSRVPRPDNWHGHVTEGNEIRQGRGRAPTGPKPPIKIVGQKPNSDHATGFYVPTRNPVPPPAPPKRRKRL